MKLEKISMLLGAIVMILLAFLIVWQADILGVSAGRLEQDARENQSIDNSWEVAQGMNEDLCAMLFYDQERDKCTYSIYVSREGFSFGYFFGKGGTDVYMTENVEAVVLEDKGIALLSLNQDKVCKIKVGDESDAEFISVNPGEPFALVLPIDCGEITLYDTKENVVTLYDTYTGI
ncbi:MAG: hypothetical protein HFH89_05060 [Lachnospiraceae bacterium]|nr:hypothetical protein [uncultured Acetatifactor sp.]MCI8287019.1 hypothetical protein [Lachnospiraceae bacterium]